LLIGCRCGVAEYADSGGDDARAAAATDMPRTLADGVE
jgi:hypothetical protein